jgi:hypothetical protein
LKRVNLIRLTVDTDISKRVHGNGGKREKKDFLIGMIFKKYFLGK